MSILQMLIDIQLKYLIGIYAIALILTFALDWQLPGFKQIESFSKNIDLDRYVIKDYMTCWQLTHFLTRFLLGFFCPKYWHVIFAIDFGWETLEWYQWQAHNWYDLIWNMLGLVIGMMTRHYGLFDKYFTSLKTKSNEDKEHLDDDDPVNSEIKPIDKDGIDSEVENTVMVHSDGGENISEDAERVQNINIDHANKLHAVEEDHHIYFSGKNTAGIQVHDGAQLLDGVSKQHRRKKSHKDKKSKKNKKENNKSQ